MYSNTKKIVVNEKTYTLTVQRSIVFTLAKIAPELLQINDNGGKSKEEVQELQLDAMAKVYDGINLLFYEMIKVAHKDITLEKSNEIFLAFRDEYDEVEENLLNFATSIFTTGVPKTDKKKLNW